MDEATQRPPLPDFFGSAAQDWAAANPGVATVIGAALLALGAYLGFVITRRLLILGLKFIVTRRGGNWEGALKGRRFFQRLAHFVPLRAVYEGLPYLPALPPTVVSPLQRFLEVWIVFAVTRAVVALVRAGGDLYAQRSEGTVRPVTVYVQVASLAAYIVAAVVSVAIIIGRDPLAILTGLGAASAVLLLIFQNTILSLVAGVQLTSTGQVKVGDWIEMPEMNANGTVTEIALNTVTVQNFDKTYTIIPAHNFLGKSFKNWQGMTESGGRRMMRALHLDASTVRFLSPADVAHLSRFELLRPYLEEKRADISAWLEEHPAAQDDPLNARRLTNLGTFRAYVEQYLRANPMISQDMSFQVRLQESGPKGLPLQIYAFVSDVRWAVYEGVQGDVFDHLFAILPEFGLQVFQEPSGADMRALGAALRAARRP